MFDPSIKKENIIVIKDNSEDSKAGVKEHAERLPLHMKEKENKNLGKTQGKGKQVAQYSTRPITRSTTKSSKVETMFKGTGGVSDDKDYLSVDPDLPKTMDSDSTDDEVHSSGLSSRYQIKLRNPQATIDLNQPTPVEKFP